MIDEIASFFPSPPKPRLCAVSASWTIRFPTLRTPSPARSLSHRTKWEGNQVRKRWLEKEGGKGKEREVTNFEVKCIQTHDTVSTHFCCSHTHTHNGEMLMYWSRSEILVHGSVAVMFYAECLCNGLALSLQISMSPVCCLCTTWLHRATTSPWWAPQWRPATQRTSWK